MTIAGQIPRLPRKGDAAPERDDRVALDLEYLAPFDWESILATFRAHQLPELEMVDSEGYERVFVIGNGRPSSLRVAHNSSGERSLRLTMSNVPEQSIPLVAQAVRRMFDLDLDPKRIAGVMDADACLSQLWSRYPGLRVARSWDRFETLVTTILGQLVSMSFGRTLTRELMECGTKAQHPKTGEPIFLFPTPEQLASCDLAAVRTTEMRRTAIRAVASLAMRQAIHLDGTVVPNDFKRTLLSTPGIGPWSAEYIAMRGFGDDDAFPATDYVLKQEIRRHPEMKIKQVRPWRAYAAAVLWKDFAARKGMPAMPT